MKEPNEDRVEDGYKKFHLLKIPVLVFALAVSLLLALPRWFLKLVRLRKLESFFGRNVFIGAWLDKYPSFFEFLAKVLFNWWTDCALLSFIAWLAVRLAICRF